MAAADSVVAAEAVASGALRAASLSGRSQVEHPRCEERCRAALAHPALPGVCERMVRRAHGEFATAVAAMARCDRRAMRPARLMGATYLAVLSRLERRGWRDLDRPAKPPKWQKLWIAVRYGFT